MPSTRRQYLTGAAGLITVSHTGKVCANEGNGPPEETPPREGESVMGLTCDPIDQVGVGVIGLGNRGPSMTEILASMYPDKLEINAICDLVEDRVQETQSMLEDEGMDPATYSAGVSEDEWDGNEAYREDDLDEMVDSGWKEMVQRDDLDIVFVFTHHRAHAPMCVYIMEQGKHAATEVPAATTIEECWDLVQASEKNQKNCIMLENFNYAEEEMWVLNMVKNDVFGELTYARGGYIHNQTGSFMHDYGPPVNWRSRMYKEEKGDLYPTHGLGMIAWYMDILHGDRFEYMTAMQSKEASFSQYAENELDEDHEFYGDTDWANGDTTRSQIKTNQGRSIEVQLDVKTKRNFVHLNTLAGTDAYHEHVNYWETGDYESKLSIGQEGYDFVDADEYEDYREQYTHPLWEELREEAEDAGHGGADFMELYRHIDALNNGRPVDMNVYDAALWSSVRPLSQISIEHGGRPVKFPEFTRGQEWQDRDLEVQNFDTI